MDLENILIKIKIFIILVNGKITYSMELENNDGNKDNFKEIINLGKNTDQESLNGMMELY